MTTKTEKSKDYRFFFEAIAKAVQQCYGEDYRPSSLVADAAGAITRGLTKAFSYEDGGDFALVICFQHVKRGYEKHMSLAEKDSRASLNKDILVLQEWSTQLIFSTVLNYLSRNGSRRNFLL